MTPHKRRRGVLVLTTSDYSLDLHMRGMLRDLHGSDLGPVHIAAADSGRLGPVSAREGVAATAVPMRREMSPAADLLALLRLLLLFLRLRPALTVYGTPKASLLGAVAAWATRVPARVYVLHGLRVETVRGARRRLLLGTERVTIALSSSVLAVSASLLTRSAQLGLDTRRMRVLGPGGFVGMDLDRHHAAGAEHVRQQHRAEMNVAPGVSLVGFAGRITRDKGIIELLDALAMLRDQGLNAELALVGEDEGIAELPARTQELLAECWVHSSGAVPDASGYIAAFDVLCLPSYREGLPTVVLEAMASGVPVVGSAATGTTDLIEHGRTGLLVPIGDAAALAGALCSMLRDPGCRQRTTVNAREHVAAFAELPMWRRHRTHYRALLRLTSRHDS